MAGVAGGDDVGVAGGDSGGEVIRVLVVDDDPLVRSALTMVLGGVEDIAVVGEVADGDEVPAAVRATAPDVVLMDIRMPRLDGLAATERLQAEPRPPAVVVLTTFDADQYVLRALRTGAAGFLLKDTPPPDLVAGIRRVAAGEPILSPTITRRLMALASGSDDAESQRDRAQTLMARLTDREAEVARAVGRGLSNAEIAGELHMSVATVKAYVSRLLTKFAATNRVQIALVTYDATG